jgi:hypothetical protein
VRIRSADTLASALSQVDSTETSSSDKIPTAAAKKAHLSQRRPFVLFSSTSWADVSRIPSCINFSPGLRVFDEPNRRMVTFESAEATKLMKVSKAEEEISTEAGLH